MLIRAGQVTVRAFRSTMTFPMRTTFSEIRSASGGSGGRDWAPTGRGITKPPKSSTLSVRRFIILRPEQPRVRPVGVVRDVTVVGVIDLEPERYDLRDVEREFQRVVAATHDGTFEEQPVVAIDAEDDAAVRPHLRVDAECRGEGLEAA